MSDLTLTCAGDIFVSPATLAHFVADPTCVEYARTVLQRADIRFANLESPLVDSGRALFGTGVRLRSPEETTRLLQFLGIDVVTLANNHMLDFGRAGLYSTLRELGRSNIAAVGAGRSIEEARRPIIRTVRGRRIAFLGACDDQGGGAGRNRPGVWLLEPRDLISAVHRLRNDADHIVVGLHTGLEFVTCPEPFFLDLAHRLIDAGACVVVGHHPHVPQGLVRYGNGLIACSLGDFLFDLPRAPDDMTPRQKSFNLLHPLLEIELESAGVAAYRLHLLTRDGMGCYGPAASRNGFDPEREFPQLCSLLDDHERLIEASRRVYAEELYQNLYTVYTAACHALRCGRTDPLRGLAWWLGTFRRAPKRRFLRQGVLAVARGLSDRWKKGTPSCK
jgi:hypothetical protein